MRNQEKIKEFFICGIHGLGTWGATHYLDRRFMDFNFGPNDNIQMLLEITYENGHIVDFKNVSEKGKTYFESACSETTIRRIIEESK